MINKSIAVIINGCLRDVSNLNILEDFTLYKKVIEETKNNLKDFETVHIYYHTWDTFQETDVLLKKYRNIGFCYKNMIHHNAGYCCIV